MMQTLGKIGPYNASQWQHRRKDATDQMKNLTLTRTRTQFLGFSSADALPTKLWIPVGRTWILILIRFQILNSLCCLPFMSTFIPGMLLLSVFSFFIIVHCWFNYIIQQFSLTYVFFFISVVKWCKPLSKLDLPTHRKGSTEERTQRNKWKIWHSLGLEPNSSAFLAPMLYPLSYGFQWAEPEF